MWTETSGREDLLKWLKAVSKDGLKPYITLEAGYGGLDRCDPLSDCPEIEPGTYEKDVRELMSELVPGKPAEGIDP